MGPDYLCGGHQIKLSHSILSIFVAVPGNLTGGHHLVAARLLSYSLPDICAAVR